MTDHLLKMWRCWISDPMHRKPIWQTWFRLLRQSPEIRDQIETRPYFDIYLQRIERGETCAEPMPRGRWINNQWIMRNKS